MPPLRLMPLANQVSLKAGLITLLCLAMTLPLTGWLVSRDLLRQADRRTEQSADSQPPALQAWLLAEQRAQTERATRTGQRIHRSLTDSLLLHDETTMVDDVALPLVTWRGRPVHQMGPALAQLLDAPDAYLLLFIKNEDGFALVADSRWADNESPMWGDSLASTAWPGLETGDSTKGNPTNIQTIETKDGPQLVYSRPLRRPNGEVAALLLQIQRVADPTPDLRNALAAWSSKQAIADRQRLEKRIWLGVVVWMGLSLLLAAVLTWVMRSLLQAALQPVKSLTQTALRLGNGDLDARATDPLKGLDGANRNELSLLARGMNRLAEQMQHLLNSVRNHTLQVAHSAGTVTASAAQLNEGAARERSAATDMAAAIEEMTSSIASVGQNAEEARGISQRAHELVSEGSSAVASATQQMQSLSQTVQTTSDVIEQLGQQSQQISTIVAMIKEIAEQTNLLALNAAIEAARAGENGRGFSVVADEVRRLAERTSDSTEQIHSMINAIQGSAHTAVENMESAVSSVTEGVRLVSHVGDTIGRIHEDASHVATAVDAIHVALREQNSASNSIAQQVDCLARMSDTNHAAAVAASEASAELEATAHQILQAVERFNKRKHT